MGCGFGVGFDCMTYDQGRWRGRRAVAHGSNHPEPLKSAEFHCGLSHTR